jgi:hypothetical protein
VRPAPRALLLIAGASALVAPATGLGQSTAPGGAVIAPGDLPAFRAAALDAAAAWRDSLEAVRAPRLPTPGDRESVILILADPPAAASDPADHPAAAGALSERHDALASTLASLGATVTFRYRMLIDALAVTLPAGRLEAVAALPEVAAVVPVTYLAPAQAEGGAADPAALPPSSTAPAAPATSGRPLHVALIDAGVDVSHPWLGGGIGPTFPVLGGADLVDGDADPRPSGADPALEAHGTQMASILLRSPALAGLPPERIPRLLAYRVVAPEPVGGRLRPLARTDRVLAALERAIDPDGDGDTADGAEVILLGLADGFAGGGIDPVSDALEAADRVGATVVAPAGNDGPTFTRPGAVGGPASGPTVIAVGGLSAASAPRTAALDVHLGPAEARLGPLPLMGAAPPAAELPVVVLRDDAGIATGGAPEAFRAPDGSSRVAGALVVLARGAGPIPATAARAAEAGAAAVALWDADGRGSFPAAPGDAGMSIPVVGLGARQGDALVRLAAGDPALTVTLTATPAAYAAATVASFSSWGPTADGRQKPDLVAPAVDQAAAWPGRAADGVARTASLTGTSAAAAHVAALALRLRVDDPSLGPRAVRSLLIQSARVIPGVAVQRQGAGVAAAPAPRAVRIEPAIVTSEHSRDATRAEVSLSGIAATGGGSYTVSFSDGAREAVLTEVALPVGAARRLELVLPSGRGSLIVRDAAGATAATAPVLPRRASRTPGDAVGVPEVAADSRLAEVRVRLGILRREDSRLRSVRVHGVRLHLVPAGGGESLLVSGAKQDGDWAAGTYRFLVARRLASGLDVPAGRYRLSVTAAGPDGAALRRLSAPFTLG